MQCCDIITPNKSRLPWLLVGFDSYRYELSIGGIYFGSNSAKAAVAGFSIQETNMTWYSQFGKSCTSILWLATGAYTEGNEVGPFLNTSSLHKMVERKHENRIWPETADLQCTNRISYRQ